MGDGQLQSLRIRQKLLLPREGGRQVNEMATKPGLNPAVVDWICPSHEVICRTISFFNQAAVRVDSRAVVLLFGLLLAQPQDVLQPVKSHLHNL